ncbi:hypothetical protein BGX38DRAFT_63677 [Terfezia claveryi]|nr:hypothetical protein BGX38DRAFT_63677 [Terfezia claveryi]
MTDWSLRCHTLSALLKKVLACLSPFQFGSSKGRSPLDAVHLLLEKVTKASHQGLFSSALFLDVMGAFATRFSMVSLPKSWLNAVSTLT